MKIAVDRGDGTSFDGVSDGTITVSGNGTTGASIIFPGLGWAMVAGSHPKMKNNTAAIAASGSKILLQNFPAPPGGARKTRVLVVDASNGATVDALDASDSRALTAGQYVDIVNTNPIQIGQPNTYVPATMPETATALAAAEDAMENEEPEP